MSAKMTKGTVAIAAGVVLLLGGAGTYALWEVNEALDGSVESGDLNLELGDGDWMLNGAVVEDAASVLIVPGDTLELSQQMTVTVIGDTLEAELGVEEAGTFIPDELTEYMAVDFSIDAPWADSAGDGTYLISSDPAPRDGTAEVTLTFSEETPDRVGVNTELDLNGLQFTLEQVLDSQD